MIEGFSRCAVGLSIYVAICMLRATRRRTGPRLASGLRPWTCRTSEQTSRLSGTGRRIRLIGGSWDRLPAGEHFAAAMGATAVPRTHTNHLPLAGVDRTVLEQWVADAPTRAPGYELVAWDGPISEEHLDAFVDLMLVMNDAPGTTDLNDFTLTPERWREAEQQGRDHASRAIFCRGLTGWGPRSVADFVPGLGWVPFAGPVPFPFPFLRSRTGLTSKRSDNPPENAGSVSGPDRALVGAAGR